MIFQTATVLAILWRLVIVDKVERESVIVLIIDGSIDGSNIVLLAGNSLLGVFVFCIMNVPPFTYFIRSMI